MRHDRYIYFETIGIISLWLKYFWEKRVRQIPKQTLLRLASDSRTKPEIKSTTAKPVEETHFEEFFQHNTSGRVARKHLSQSFSSNLKEESVVSNRSEEGRILRFLIEKSD